MAAKTAQHPDGTRFRRFRTAARQPAPAAGKASCGGAPADNTVRLRETGMSERAVARHYRSAGITGRVVDALRAWAGAAAAVTPETLAPFDHFHGRGVAATRETMAHLAPRPGERLLDIGSGIGGPARFIAAHHDVCVTGVDLTEEFCAAAAELNVLTGLAGRVHVVVGSALALPLADAVFDAAYSQNVIMNIADKHGFYHEAFRTLRPGGRLALSNLCAGPAGDPYFPAPWAATPDLSFLEPPQSMRAGLQAAGFEIVDFRDLTASILDAHRTLAGRPTATAPRVAIEVLMGARAAQMQRNSIRTLSDGRGLAIEAVVRRP
jgi:SAM-dependent methyltransferase